MCEVFRKVPPLCSGILRKSDISSRKTASPVLGQLQLFNSGTCSRQRSLILSSRVGLRDMGKVIMTGDVTAIRTNIRVRTSCLGV
jgi:hypothetical protein